MKNDKDEDGDGTKRVTYFITNNFVGLSYSYQTENKKKKKNSHVKAEMNDENVFLFAIDGYSFNFLPLCAYILNFVRVSVRFFLVNFSFHSNTKLY